MNKRQFLKLIAGTLAALPFMGWLGKAKADGIPDIANIISRGEWVSGDTIVFPIDTPANATITSVRVYDHDNNEVPVLNIDYDNPNRCEINCEQH